MYDAPTYFAWFVLALLFGVAVAFIVWIGSLPRQIAVRRQHPQVDAINALSWLGLLFGGVGWVVAFVWALLRSGPCGSESAVAELAGADRLAELQRENEMLQAKVARLEEQLAAARRRQE